MPQPVRISIEKHLKEEHGNASRAKVKLWSIWIESCPTRSNNRKAS